MHMHDLIRQPRSSTNPLDRNEHRLTNNIVISTRSARARRLVETSNDWFEVMFSSILPIQAYIIQQSNTLEAAQQAAANLQNLFSFCLNAINLFKQYPFQPSSKYLESHRETCTNASSTNNIAVPNVQKIQQIIHSVVYSNLSATTTPTRSSSAPTASSYTYSNRSPSNNNNNNRNNKSDNNAKKSYSPADGICGKYNSFNGCKDTNCSFSHHCRECKQPGHSKPRCPTIKQESKVPIKYN